MSPSPRSSSRTKPAGKAAAGRKPSKAPKRRSRSAPAITSPSIMAYVRVSTEGQSEETGLESQRHAIIAYAAANGMKIDAWLSDIESGAVEERPGLASIRKAAAAGMVQTLLVYRIDRLARDVRLGETVYRELQAAGARVISVSEVMMDGSLTGNLMRTIILAFAEYERSVITLRTMTGRRHRVAHTGSWGGGVAPYGYEAVGDRSNPGHGELKVNDVQAVAVRRIFDLSAQGQSLPAIAGALNTEGYRTSRGSMFGPMQVSRILARREVYQAIVAVTPSITLKDGVAPKHHAIL